VNPVRIAVNLPQFALVQKHLHAGFGWIALKVVCHDSPVVEWGDIVAIARKKSSQGRGLSAPDNHRPALFNVMRFNTAARPD
jgi:hypothetical protein